ncbi:hypothetical protein [Prauserella flavalba]|uniref:hypothetical protein n=1 Tax=Prauserella flavalba TaxID=1477506 RepID=UPI0011B53CDB|nr:hypothetical protein [Prauserella flavalba]
MTASTESDPVLDILGDITKIFGSLFDQMDWAEEEIARAITTNPAEADTLYHGFSLLTPTHERMSREFVFRPHCRENPESGRQRRRHQTGHGSRSVLRLQRSQHDCPDAIRCRRTVRPHVGRCLPRCSRVR